jgi:hypothetical protein
MSEEYNAFVWNGTWELLPSNPSQNVVGCKWIFHTKQNSDGYIDRHKSCNKLKIGRFTVLPPTNWSVRSYVVSIDALFINQKDAVFGTILEANFMYNHQGRIHGKSPYLLETKIDGKSYGSFVTCSRSMGLLHIMHCQVLENFQIQFYFILVIIYFMI